LKVSETFGAGKNNFSSFILKSIFRAFNAKKCETSGGKNLNKNITNFIASLLLKQS
jgi:hypothetical protein